ncbi:MAG: glycosyltransferase family 39 protein [Clostridiales bacterium]|nr:glycosyltransferase family 39 protein [Clostridiales bacterium]
MTKKNKKKKTGIFQKIETLSVFDDRSNPRLVKADRRLILSLVLIYSLMALLNLGTFNFPQSAWLPELGETVVLDFGQEVEIDTCVANPNFFVDIPAYWADPYDKSSTGEVTITTDAGQSFSFVHEREQLYQWYGAQLGIRTRTLTLTVTQEKIALNEMAFFDAEGKLLPVAVVSETGVQLVDEQHTAQAETLYFGFNGMYFDENLYAITAQQHLHGQEPYEWTHPPLGKLLISVGIAVFGMVPFGWRIMGVLFGALMIPILYIFAKRIFKRTDFAFIAAALLTFDCMHFTLARVSNIDVFSAVFILLMFLFMFDYINLNFYDVPLKKTLKPLLLSGLFFGMTISVKWNGFYGGAGLAILLFWTLASRLRERIKAKTERERERTKTFGRNTMLTLAACLAFFIVIPALIYFLSYISYYIYEASLAEGSYGIEDSVRTLWRYQQDMFRYHNTLDFGHEYQSRWHQWLIMERPIRYWSIVTPTLVSCMTLTGNPIVWFVGTAGALGLVCARITGWFKGNRATLLLAIAVLSNLLPWAFLSRTTFIYHYFATLPFMLLAGLYFLYIWEQKNKKTYWFKWALLAAAIVFFALMFPAISGIPMPSWYAWFLEYCLPTGSLFYGYV